MKAKRLYDRLARTPHLGPAKVAKMRAKGMSLEEIASRFRSPPSKSTTDPFCTPACRDYPAQLLHLHDPPMRLFHRGRPTDELSQPIIGVVGSRGASRFGQFWARKLGASLARRGASVCSGLALGIDGAVHHGVLDEIRRNPKAAAPVAVLGHGWGMISPQSNASLAKEVEQRGTLLTEYQRGTPPTRWSFPARNRIIAALSDHVVVVEAGPRSGSLYTAEFALELGRKVWIVPNAPGRPNSKGVLELWRSGAEPILDLEEFAETVAPSMRLKSTSQSPLLNLGSKAAMLLNHLAGNDGVVDEICESGDWTPTELAYQLTELEIAGLIRRTLDGHWDILCWDLLGDLT